MISAILLLLHQKWRTSINRFAEAMTLFAVACAGLFPLLHLGRPWFFYWLLPYPNTMGLWPQLRSPLVWDVFAVSTYFTVSLLFWYVGLIPDLATLRDRSHAPFGRIVYGILAMGWRGSARHWQRYEIGLSAAGRPGDAAGGLGAYGGQLRFRRRHRARLALDHFPPYFVAGAIYSGFAMVLTLAIPAARLLRPGGLHHHAPSRQHGQDHAGHRPDGRLRLRHRSASWPGTAATPYEQYMMLNRMFGPYAPCYWVLMPATCLIPQVLWFERSAPIVRCCSSSRWSSMLGMWLERFVIVVTSLHRDFLPSSWGMYYSDSGTGRRCSARSDCSLPCCSCSSASCR